MQSIVTGVGHAASTLALDDAVCIELVTCLVVHCASSVCCNTLLERFYCAILLDIAIEGIILSPVQQGEAWWFICTFPASVYAGYCSVR